tara:strand:- start:7132 stop:7992 length:861 start_codon:yes stop_codon:yes gene_type:complete
MKNVLLKSPAKINLFLKVGNKIKNRKYHNIQSLIFLTDLYDEILLSKTNKNIDEIKFTGRFKRGIKKNDNSIIKSISLLKKKGFINKKTNYKITIKKNIPVYSGLGGGSSNAATIIKYFLKKKKISKNNINYFSRVLGSDFKVFLKTKKVFQINLNTINEFKFSHNFYVLIIFPYIKCSTRDIYSKFKEYEFIDKKDEYKKISKLELANKLKLEINSLENVITSRFPIIENILEELDFLKNCEFSRVTGSGSACFALFLNKKAGRAGLKRIKKRFPAFWCVLSKTI